MTGDQKKQILSEFLDRIWSRGDYDAIPDFIAQRYAILNDPGDPWEGQVLDHPGYRDRIEKSRAPFPDQSFDVVSMLADDDAIAVSWNWQGTHLGPVAGFEATGKIITMTGMTIYGFEGGLLNSHWQVADRLGVFMQLRANAA
ncbi:ester cyclase [Hyphobacterium sp. HN65]|uniref:Ester cyclase n=1 Tax=Hyphobacterium lacteum TaxID=3116575 RepID=A0ABU7LQ97_9PROT|nr:ester cyclase [Hyphobacterium sp. HN65]MEE2526091.1 ester cyclase [Hyphobacterium sp. HN65]